MDFEVEIIKSLQSLHSVFLDRFFLIISLLGSFVGAITLFIVIFCKSRHLACVYGVTYICAIAFNSLILKPLFSRTRPYSAYPFDIMSIGSDSVSGSMPSGHSISCAIIVFFLLIYILMFVKNKKVKIFITILSFLFLALVMISRMYLGQHYLSDVIVGAVLGFIISVIGLISDYKRMRRWVIKHYGEDYLDKK